MWQSSKNFIHLLQAIAANIIYGFPARGLTIVGVTGTDGKTTTASLLYHILQQSGKRVGLVTSVGAFLNGKAFETGFHVTTPSSFAIQAFLRKAKNAGVTHVVLEVSSHGLDQHRVWGIPFAVGVLTNITNEHLDYHKTYERYVAAKAKLLKAAKIAILNKEDKSYWRIKKYELRSKNKKIVTYGLKKDSDINPHNFPFHTKLFGQFNTYNCLAAIATTRNLGIADEKIRKAVASFKAPIGREEIVYDKEFKVIIDFAHTANAFVQLLPEIRKFTKNRLIHVFGAAARRDTFKRPEMGKTSSKYADIIILTSEDPRDEEIEEIFGQIAKGIPKNTFQTFEHGSDKAGKPHPESSPDTADIPDSGQARNIQKFMMERKNHGLQKFLFKIPDRKEAIEFAIAIAQRGDTVLLTGKGHERSMNYGRGEEPWNEHAVVKEALKARGLGFSI